MWSHEALEGVDLAATVERLRGRVRPTTVIESEALDHEVGHGIHVIIASETFQHTGSFKFRAAISVALHSQAPGLLTASSGNFGAALALASSKVGKPCTVVMPAKSAQVKVSAVRRHGATVDLIDTALVTRSARVAELHRANPTAQVVSPYDDPYVIAGNASLGWEIFERKPDVVLTPVGGGGLASGVVAARNFLGAGCPVWGAEPALANDAARSFRSGQLESNAQPEPPTICDGARTASLGRRNWEILHGRQGLEGIIEVGDETVAMAVKLLFDAVNLKAEPTGCLPIAALLATPDKFAGRQVACIVSGGNVDAALYASLVAGPHAA